jgi:hypothetical protein
VTPERWALIPTVDCYIAGPPCIVATAGQYNCDGCLENGRRMLPGAALMVNVAVDAHGRPVGIDLEELS